MGSSKRIHQGRGGFDGANVPDRFLAVMSKSRRKGKIFIDYLRNASGATAIAPYSLRAGQRAGGHTYRLGRALQGRPFRSLQLAHGPVTLVGAEVRPMGGFSRAAPVDQQGNVQTSRVRGLSPAVPAIGAFIIYIYI